MDAVLTHTNEKFVDMIEAGIPDPVKVTRSALQNVLPALHLPFTTEFVVVAIMSRPRSPAAPDMGGMY